MQVGWPCTVGCSGWLCMAAVGGCAWLLGCSGLALHSGVQWVTVHGCSGWLCMAAWMQWAGPDDKPDWAGLPSLPPGRCSNCCSLTCLRDGLRPKLGQQSYKPCFLVKKAPRMPNELLACV